MLKTKVSETVRMSVSVSSELNQLLEGLAVANHCSKGEVIRKGLAIMKAAEDARHNDQHLALVDEAGQEKVRLIGI